MNFPPFVYQLPKADLPFDGVQAFLLQGDNHQILFMEFSKDMDLSEHSHTSQWGVVVNGTIDMVIDNNSNTYHKGDNYYVPDGVKHYGKIYKGYAEIAFIEEKDRYQTK